jgi:trigger factor
MSTQGTSAATVEDLSAVRKRLQIEVPLDEVQRELDRAYESVRHSSRLRGFRPGKAPRHVLESVYGEQVKHEVMSRLVEASFHRAVEEHAFAIVGSPEIDVDHLEKGEAFRYTATFDVRPAIQVGDLSGITVERRVPIVTDDDVEKTLGRLRDSAAQLRPIDDRGVVEAGDVVTLDLTSRLGDAEPQERTDVMLEAGTGAFPEAIEQCLVGQHVGADFESDVSYPEDYGNQGLAGRTVHFAGRVKSLHHKDLPPLDDDFARDQGHAESLADLRDKIRADLEAQARDHAQSEVREAVMRQLVERHTFEVPESLVERRCDAMLASLGVRAPEGAEAEALIGRLREQVRPRAEDDVRADLVLDALMARERLEPLEEEVEGEIAAIVEHEKEPERVRAFYARPEAHAALRTRLGRARAFDYVLTQVAITDAGDAKQVAHP